MRPVMVFTLTFSKTRINSFSFVEHEMDVGIVVAPDKPQRQAPKCLCMSM